MSLSNFDLPPTGSGRPATSRLAVLWAFPGRWLFHCLVDAPQRARVARCGSLWTGVSHGVVGTVAWYLPRAKLTRLMADRRRRARLLATLDAGF